MCRLQATCASLATGSYSQVLSGPFHGIVAFIVVVITMILAEEGLRKIYFALDGKADGSVAVA